MRAKCWILSGLFLLPACSKKKPEVPLPDFHQIREEGKIKVLLYPSSTTYFVYKGEQMGYEYELLRDFADANHLEIDLRLAANETRMREMLESGEGDLIACNLPVTIKGKETLLYCGKRVLSEQVLVQRSDVKDSILHDVTELIGKEVWVMDQSRYHRRLTNLNEELGGGITIRTMDRDTISVEELIEMVASGEISYTLSDSDLAQLNKTYHNNLHVSLKVSHPQPLSWAVRKDMPQLAEALDDWFEKNRKKQRYRKIEKRYFEMSKMPDHTRIKPIAPGKISHFDELFKKYAPQLEWDWMLLASIAYQESKFHTDRESWAGAVGLMGVMPRTAQAFGIGADEITDPEANLRAAVALIAKLDNSFQTIEDKSERIKFILASYNAGSGHIYDAMALAEKLGKNPSVWNGQVEECLRLKSLPEYYNDPVCKQGYVRGKETVRFVEDVLDRWNYYREEVKESS